jgi:hypothetical protein
MYCIYATALADDLRWQWLGTMSSVAILPEVSGIFETGVRKLVHPPEFLNRFFCLSKKGRYVCYYCLTV